MIQKIYDNSPVFLQNVMISIKGLQIIRQRYNKYYKEEMELLTSNIDPFKLQEDRLKLFYDYITNHSEYFSRMKNIINEKLTISDINKLPLMNKETIRNHLDEIVTRDRELIEMGTGGSTGKSMKYYTHPYDISRKIAYLDFFKLKHGVKLGMKRASVGGRSIVPMNQKSNVFWRYNYFLKQLYFSAYHADGNNLKYYIEKLNEFKPLSIDGYTTVIHRWAQYINNNNIELTFKPIAIFPTAEALTPEMKNDIEKAFKCPVRNQYASSEGAPFITENINGELEINPETGVFECRKIEGNIYELVVTGFYTTTTPLLRYEIGDSVELNQELPEKYSQKDIKIKRIIGRNNDFLMSNERGIITNVNLSTAIKAAGNSVIASQFIQNEINEVILNLVVKENVDRKRLEKILVEQLNIRFGHTTLYKFNYVDRIDVTKGGKTRFTINNLGNEVVK
ncbi:phenylacetate--CoA ligase family protein [Phocicoccus pinnipedialis]|uniref:Phenylacetate-coenzyme A ligase n=1 Tax=Phocicoccus pinnipedialis TaxID=110845 RepID=A0A6V7RNV6_9BACL|nr:phenylacetate--CoA ligase family protein [Jeotgalicoccus pinnipedialis]MBP1938811.1 phenylacetate-CoA ligase [Jeotgalicoccus pinnipedialis]CAD2079251.1 hypothetical protein JEOPIN946_01539 [Jeotgalicoccus pinnipedialis]